MERWEFLIQKEGDRIWTPINEVTWELEEGKYRMMAHSSHPNFQVEIRITHQIPESGEGFNLIQNYRRRTNEQGLMMILPYTYFGAGIWEIRCYRDLMAELCGKHWQKRVQLKIKAKVEQNSSVDRPLKDLFSPHQPISNTQSKAEYYLQQLETLLREEIEPILRLPASLREERLPVPIESEIKVKLSLNQDEFSRSEGEAILLSGEVESLDKDAREFTGKLYYQLLDPDTDEIILSIEEDLQSQKIPFIFEYALEIPDELELEFWQGKVILKNNLGDLMSEKSFIITTEYAPVITNPINYTITLSDSKNHASFAFDLMLDEKIVTTPLNVELPEPAKMRHNSTQYQTSRGQILPPKIASESVKDKTPKLPQLPPRS